ncbi:hypothetical protein HM1_1468 [Heliomicrobium modesticaldum Ice1]|uniref:Uncharacterized protein n=1 Tax=Heliobacterium modesticaldum (strain ATCC 51547 / Ice1) TaxID=498761 RepID=B0TCL5_HELMI|nr:hypothetical protein HM1_1468 [Heliomicrobium modesticaldum Ice1]
MLFGRPVSHRLPPLSFDRSVYRSNVCGKREKGTQAALPTTFWDKPLLKNRR